MKTKILLVIVVIFLGSYVVIGLSPTNDTYESDRSEPIVTSKEVINTPTDFTQTNHQPAESEIANGNLPKVDAEESFKKHHQIAPDIKRAMCVADNDKYSCVIDINKDFTSVLLYANGSTRSDEIGVLLGSKNFDEAISSMAAKKTTNEAIEREYEYQSQVNKLTQELGILNTSVYCGDDACAISLIQISPEQSEGFFDVFFRKNSKGNIFSSDSIAPNGVDIDEKIVFFPNNYKSVKRRIKD